MHLLLQSRFKAFCGSVGNELNLVKTNIARLFHASRTFYRGMDKTFYASLVYHMNHEMSHFLKKGLLLNINGALLVSFWLQVFFCVLVGTFSIGNITPHVTTVAGAKGAAAVLIDIIDNVSTWMEPEKFVRERGNWNCLGQFLQILWNQTTDVHRGSSLITWVITWRWCYITWRWPNINHVNTITSLNAAKQTA